MSSTSKMGYLTSRLHSAQESASLERQTQEDLEQNFLEYFPTDQDAHILEIGFGSGAVLDFLRAQGYRNYEGIDVDHEAYETCREKHTVYLVRDVGEFLQDKLDHYHVILMKNVLSHIARENLIRLLESIHAALRINAVLLLETFNGGIPSAYYTFTNDFTHEIAFTENSLRQVLQLAGFRQILIRGGRITKKGSKRRIFLFLRYLYMLRVRWRLILERGRGGNPTIESKALIAIARKGP